MIMAKSPAYVRSQQGRICHVDTSSREKHNVKRGLHRGGLSGPEIYDISVGNAKLATHAMGIIYNGMAYMITYSTNSYICIRIHYGILVHDERWRYRSTLINNSHA